MAGVEQSISAWSFSRLQDWRKCPRYAYFKHCLKLKEPGNDAMQRGSRVDDEVSGYIAGRARSLPAEASRFKEQLAAVRRAGAVVQEQWAFTSEWQPADWFAGNAWLRIKTDFHRYDPKTGVLLLVDNKTGKVRQEHDEQLDLYALGALCRPWPGALAAVDVRIWYLDQGEEKPEAEKLYSAADLPRLKKYWLKQAGPMLKDRQFKERPSSACTYCHFSKGKGGPCKY